MTESDYRLLTIDEAARLADVRWQTIRALIDSGQLRHVKIGSRYRVPASALAEVGNSSLARLVVGHPGGSSVPPDGAQKSRPGTKNDPLLQFKRRKNAGG